MTLEEITCAFECKLQELSLEKYVVECGKMANGNVLHLKAYFNVGSKHKSKNYYKTLYCESIDKHYTARLERMFVSTNTSELELKDVLSDHAWLYISINKKGHGSILTLLSDIIKNEKCKV